MFDGVFLHDLEMAPLKIADQQLHKSKCKNLVVPVPSPPKDGKSYVLGKLV